MTAAHLSRSALARHAFDMAGNRLECDRKAGRISAADAMTKHRALYAAYQFRKQQIELGAFLGARGLGFIQDRHYGSRFASVGSV